MSDEAPKITVKLPGSSAGIVPIKAKTFKTGSIGYFGAGKYDGPEGKRYQVTVNLVLIGSKPKPVVKAEAAA